MSVTIYDFGTGSQDTRYTPSTETPPVLTASLVSASEIDFTGTYNGQPITLWFKGNFDLSRVPQGAALFSQFQPLAENAVITSFGFKNYWTASYSPGVSFTQAFEIIDPKSNLDYESAFSGSDVYINSAQANYSADYFLGS